MTKCKPNCWRPLLIAVWLTLSGVAIAAPPSQAPSPAADAAAAAAEPTPPAEAAKPAAAPKPALRSLRNPLPDFGALPPPTVPEVFSGYPGAPAYTIVPRKPELPLYPCSMCHNLQKLNTTVRTFKVAPPPDGAPHAGVMRHGKGRFWCLDCHYAQDREWLRTLNNQKVDFNDAPLVCGQCHSARYRDWVFGGHGKRVAGWTGERQLYSCVHCHDPHVPVLPGRPPSKAPPVRAGLQPMPVVMHGPAAHAAAVSGAATAPDANASAQGKNDGLEAKR